MTISCTANTITLSGTCGVEEVEALVEHLESHPQATVDLDGATAVHTALWQALMVYKPNVEASARAEAMGQIMSALCTFLDKSHAT